MDQKKVLEKINKFKTDLANGRPVLYKLKDDITLFSNYFFKNPLNLEQEFIPYAWQDSVFSDKNDRLVACTSRQIGKSTTAAMMALHYAYFNDSATVLVISKTYPQSLEFIERIQNLVKNSASFGWEDLKPNEKESRAVFKLKNQGKKTYSRILSLPPTDAARGYTADIVICDEAAFWEGLGEGRDGDYIFHQVVSPTVFATKGKIIVISTPNGQQGFFWDIFNSKYWSGYQFDWRANPEMTEERYKRETDGIMKLRIDSEYGAEFVSPINAYFTVDEVEYAISNYKIIPERESPVKVIACDLGKIHDQAVILLGSIENPEADPKDAMIRVEKRIVKPLGTNYAAIIGEIKDLYAKEKPISIVLDATAIGEGPAEFLASEGLPVEPVKFSLQKKAQIYGTLKVLFEQKRIKIPDAKQMKDQLSSMMYEYTSVGAPKIYPPSSMHDDECDALALLAHGLTNSLIAPASITVIPKAGSVQKQVIAPGSKLRFCDECDDYNWNNCSHS